MDRKERLEVVEVGWIVCFTCYYLGLAVNLGQAIGNLVLCGCACLR